MCNRIYAGYKRPLEGVLFLPVIFIFMVTFNLVLKYSIKNKIIL